MKIGTRGCLLALAITACSGNNQTVVDGAVTVDATLADGQADAPGVPAFPCAGLGSSWLRCAGNPLYVAGRKMSDNKLELSVGDPDVSYDVQEHKWKAWWSTGASLRFADPQQSFYIMYGESLDGITWTVQAEPALRPSSDLTNWDSTKLETPSVIKVMSNPPDRRYVMFYAGGNDADFPQTAQLAYTWYQIGVAFSADGKSFTRLPAAESPYANAADTGFRHIEGLLLLGKDAFPGLADVGAGVVADPEVIFDGANYHLFFSSLAAKTDRVSYLGYGISHATLSAMDTPRLRLAVGNPQATLIGAAQPSIVKTETGFELYAIYDSAADAALVPSQFNPYYGIFKHTSTDLMTWSAKPANHEFSMAGAGPNEKYGMIKAGDMTYADGIHRYYYPAFRSDNVPPEFYCPVRAGSVMPLPTGSIAAISPGTDLVPGVMALHVAAKR